jgi:hypothetical protein
VGGHPYWYFVAHDEDAGRALQSLRKREFDAGRYNPVTRFPGFPVTPASPHPEAKHRSIEAALEDTAEDGTRSILDIHGVGERADYGVAVLLPKGMLQSLYGTPFPTREMVESNMEFLNEIERGQCVYFTIYRDGKPDELLFAGYSYD